MLQRCGRTAAGAERRGAHARSLGAAHLVLHAPAEQCAMGPATRRSLCDPQRSRRPGVAVAAAPQQQAPLPPRPTPPGRIQPGQPGGPGMPPPPPGYAQQQQPMYPPPGPQQQPLGGGPPPPPQPAQPWQPQERAGLGSYANALVAAAFIAGLGMGVYFDSEVALSPYNVSSTEIIDRGTPNADICMANGYSASVFDMKLYVTFNPFNVYTTQPVIKSGCVLRRANVGVLERENLVTTHQVEQCKQGMNTFAYMGDLKNSPEVACVYHSEEAENQYLNNLRKGERGPPIMMRSTAAAAAAGAQAPAGTAASPSSP